MQQVLTEIVSRNNFGRNDVVERRGCKSKSSRSQQEYYPEIILEEVILLKEEEAVRAAGPNPLCPPR